MVSLAHWAYLAAGAVAGLVLGYGLGALTVAVRQVAAAELHPDDIPGGTRAEQ